jgi:uroporphyrinogen-III synthase
LSTQAKVEQIAEDAADVLGPKPVALAWLQEVRMACLGYMTAEELIEQGLESVVLLFIDELRHGSRG